MSLEAVLKQSLGYATVRSVGRRGYGDTASGSAFEVTDDAGNKERILLETVTVNDQYVNEYVFCTVNGVRQIELTARRQEDVRGRIRQP